MMLSIEPSVAVSQLQYMKKGRNNSELLTTKQIECLCTMLLTDDKEGREVEKRLLLLHLQYTTHTSAAR